MIADLIVGVFQLLGFAVGFAVKCVDLGRRASFEQAMREALEPYMSVLTAKRSKMLSLDDYGTVQTARWSKELGYFMGAVLFPRLGSYESYARRNLAYASGLVDDLIAAAHPIPGVDNRVDSSSA